MNYPSILIILWLSLTVIMFFVNPLFGIATAWFGLTLLGLNYFQKRDYGIIKKILFSRLILFLLFISILVWVVYIDYRYSPLSYKEEVGFIGELLATFKGMIVYYTLVSLLFILNFLNLIYTSRQRYERTKLLGMVEITVVLIFVIVGFVYTFI